MYSFRYHTLSTFFSQTLIIFSCVYTPAYRVNKQISTSTFNNLLKSKKKKVALQNNLFKKILNCNINKLILHFRLYDLLFDIFIISYIKSQITKVMKIIKITKV